MSVLRRPAPRWSIKHRRCAAILRTTTAPSRGFRERGHPAPWARARAVLGGAAMLTIHGLTVRLGGRTLLYPPSASLPAKHRPGLLGRHGAANSTPTTDRTATLRGAAAGHEMPRKPRPA